MTKGFTTEWVRHLPEEERKEFEQLVRNSTVVLGRLMQIIDMKIESIEREELNKETYENPGYPYWQAHVNGRVGGLSEIRRLLEFMEK